jgi:type IV pilus assembly protein PilM
MGAQLRRIFKSTPKPLVGLDLGSSSLKWVELTRDDKAGLVLERCVMAPLPVGCIVAGHVAQFDEVAAMLQHLVKLSGSNTRQVALAMPDSAVIVSKIRLPSDLGEAELLRQVEAEVERVSGKSLADMSVDYRVQGRTHEPRLGAEVDVLIAAAGKEKVQDRLGLAEAAGLQAVVLDVESEASMLAALWMVRTMHPESANAVMALIQVETDGYSLHVTYQGSVIHASQKPFESSHPKGQSAQAHAKDEGCVEPLAEKLASELDGFLSTSSHRTMDIILLAGGVSWLVALQQAIMRRTFSNCVLVDTFNGMSVSESLQGTPFHSVGRSSMLTACGLAMRRFHGSC